MKDRYREETNEDVYSEDTCCGCGCGGSYSDEYVKWLESEVKKLHSQNVSDSVLSKCTRVEVIEDSDRAYINWKDTNRVQIQMQDDNKTLKIFIT